MTALAVVPRETEEAEGNLVLQIPVDQIDVGDNVRVNVDGVEELAESIKAHGLKQPIKVRASSGRWVVVWGQRRLLAHRMAGIERIPAIIADEAYTAGSLAIEQLVENLHRVDLPPLDRARAMRTVVDAGTSQADLARELGLHPSTVANDLGLLESPAEIRTSIEAGQLSPAHAKALKGLGPKTQVSMAKEAIERGYSAHRLEEEVQRAKRQEEAQAKRAAEDATRQKEDRAAIATAIAELATKKKPGLEAEIVVFEDYDRGDAAIKALPDQLTAAGFTHARRATKHGEAEPRPSGGVCTCTAFRATITSSYSYSTGGYTKRLQVTPACVVPKHRQAKATADRKAEVDKYAVQDKVHKHVEATAAAWPIPGAGAIAVDRILAESALWGLLGYRLPDWSVAHGGKRNTAWSVIHALTDEDLAKELAKELAADFRDKAGYHIDWTALGAELLPAPEESQPDPPADTRPQPEVGDPVVSKDGGPGIADGTKFRIRAIGLHAVSLAEAGPSWRKSDVMALADPGRLAYDKVAGLWRGPVVPTAGPVERLA